MIGTNDPLDIDLIYRSKAAEWYTRFFLIAKISDESLQLAILSYI